MKIKSTIWLLVLVLASTCTKAEARYSSNLEIRVVNNASFELRFGLTEEASVEVRIHDKQGLRIFKETLERSKLNKRRYNLSSLPSGKYLLLVSYNNQTKIQELEIKEGDLAIDSEKEQTVFAPTITQNKDYLDISMLNLSNHKLEIEIWDKDGNRIYKEEVSDGAVQRRYNLSKLKKATYTVRVALADDSLNKEFVQRIDWMPEN